jgi:hypothetical protein
MRKTGILKKGDEGDKCISGSADFFETSTRGHPLPVCRYLHGARHLPG